MCKEKVAEPKLRKRQPTRDGEEATSEFCKCITAVRIKVLFFIQCCRVRGGIYGQVSAGGRRSAAVCLKLSTNTLSFSITHKAGIILWSLVGSRTVSLNA